MDLTSFHQNLPIKFKELLNIVINSGFKLGLVGGTPRDFILNNKIGNDFDSELRTDENSNIEDWEKLLENLKKDYQVNELAYKVIRISIDDLSIELSLPRLEVFDGSISHSNFKAVHIEDKDYSQGFLRRDFTINAIMFEYDGRTWSIIDPLNGEEDLKNKKLRACSNSFAMDPVRFIRAYRFRVNLIFDFTEELSETLAQMDLNSLTSFYLKTELSKSNRPIIMLKRVLDARPEIIDDLIIHCDNKSIIEYDKLYQGDLESHIKQAVVIPVKCRERLLNHLDMSSKNIIPNVKFDISWKTLLESDFETEEFKQFYQTLDQLEQTDLSDERLAYLADFLGIDMTIEDFKRFKTQKYTLSEQDKQSNKDHYKYIIFQKRLKALL